MKLNDRLNNGKHSSKLELPKGICDDRNLPNTDFELLWDSIILPEELKTRLLCQSILNFTLRPKFSRAKIPLHGVIVLHGPPGTGKTSLGRALASKTASSLKGNNFRYLEVEPHALASGSLGKSQQAIQQLLGSVVAEYAEEGPVIVLLDEVETLAADRAKMSLEANPIDVHRATDAVLAQLDQLAERYPQLLFIATSNYTKAIDQAFLGRADLVVEVGLPNAEARFAILADTIQTLTERYSDLKRNISSSDMKSAAALCEGLDGRRIRKAVFSALTLNKATALDPNQLSGAALVQAVKLVKKDLI